MVTSEQFRSDRLPDITIPREEVEACFIGDEKTTIFQVLKILRNLSEKVANSGCTVAYSLNCGLIGRVKI